MKIKGWVRTDDSVLMSWDNIYSGGYIDIDYDGIHDYTVIISFSNNNIKEVIKYLSKQKAIDYAIKYMKSHPRG